MARNVHPDTIFLTRFADNSMRIEVQGPRFATLAVWTFNMKACNDLRELLTGEPTEVKSGHHVGCPGYDPYGRNPEGVIPCPDCHGSGAVIHKCDEGNAPAICSNCDGEGKVSCDCGDVATARSLMIRQWGIR